LLQEGRSLIADFAVAVDRKYLLERQLMCSNFRPTMTTMKIRGLRDLEFRILVAGQREEEEFHSLYQLILHY
jgi:hypothetical protein